MINTSSEYKDVIKNNTNAVIEAEISFPSELVLPLSGKDFMSGTCEFDDSVSSSSRFDIGSPIINQFSYTLNNFDGRYNEYDFTDAVIIPKVCVSLSGSVEKIRKGVFNVEQPSSYGSTIGFTALDNMSKFERNYTEALTVYPATLRTILQDVCDKCGVVLATISFTNYDFVVEERPADKATTCLDVVAWIAQIAGCFARCNYNGELELKWYDTSAFMDDSENFHSIKSVTGLSVNTDDVVITGIQVTENDKYVEDENGSNETIDGETVLKGSEGYILSISDNPFIAYGKAEFVAQALCNKIAGMRFRPMSGNMLGNPAIEAGDGAVVTDMNGNAYNCYFTSISYKIGNYQKFSCDAETPSKNKSNSYDAKTKSIVALREKIKREETARRNSIENLATRLSNSSGLYMTIEEQEDGSSIYYMHDKSNLSDSLFIWKLTAEAIATSTDGGKTYPYGLNISGTAILERIYTIGLDADYINTGTLTAKDKDGKTIFLVNVNTGQLYIDASAAEIMLTDEEGNKTSLSAFADRISTKIEDADGKFLKIEETINGFTVTNQSGETLIDGGSIFTDNLYLHRLVSKTSANSFVEMLEDGLNFVLGNAETIGIGYDNTSGKPLPYMVFGEGTGSDGNTAGMIKKYPDGIWIGDSEDKHSGKISSGTGIYIDIKNDKSYVYLNGEGTEILDSAYLENRLEEYKAVAVFG